MLKRSCRLFCVRFFTTVLAGHQTSVVLMGRLVLSNLRVRWRISHAIRRSSIERWWRVVECSIGLLCAVSRSPARTRHVLGGHAASIPPRRLKLSLWARSVCARRKLANDAKPQTPVTAICCRFVVQRAVKSTTNRKSTTTSCTAQAHIKTKSPAATKSQLFTLLYNSLCVGLVWGKKSTTNRSSVIWA